MRRGRTHRLLRIALAGSLCTATGCWLVAGLEDRSLIGGEGADGGALDGPPGGEGSVDGGGDARVDGAPAKCYVDDPFETPPRLLTTLSSPEREYAATFSPDELEIIFQSDWDYTAEAGAPAAHPLYIAKRAARSAEFTNIDGIDIDPTKTATFASPTLATDAGTLFFVVYPNNAYPGSVYYSQRNEAGVFEEMQPATGIPSYTDYIAIDPNGEGMTFASHPEAGAPARIYQAFRKGRGVGSFVQPPDSEITDLSARVDGGFDLGSPVLSQDGNVLYFVIAPTANTKLEVWRAVRMATDGPSTGFTIDPASFKRVDEVNAFSTRSLPVWLSPDYCRLYTSHFIGTQTRDLYVFEKKPR